MSEKRLIFHDNKLHQLSISDKKMLLLRNLRKHVLSSELFWFTKFLSFFFKPQPKLVHALLCFSALIPEMKSGDTCMHKLFCSCFATLTLKLLLHNTLTFVCFSHHVVCILWINATTDKMKKGPVFDPKVVVDRLHKHPEVKMLLACCCEVNHDKQN